MLNGLFYTLAGFDRWYFMLLSIAILYSIAWIPVAAMPGPTMMLMLSNGLTKNKRLVLMGMLGANLANLANVLIITAVALGLGAVLQTSETIFSIIKWGGVAYLLWLAWNMWHAQPEASLSLNASSSKNTINKKYTPLQAFRRNLLVGVSNPKGILFLTAFMPQFIDFSQPQLSQYALLTLLTLSFDTVFMVCYSSFGLRMAKLLTVRNLKKLNRCSSVVMVCMLAAWRFIAKRLKKATTGGILFFFNGNWFEISATLFVNIRNEPIYFLIVLRRTLPLVDFVKGIYRRKAGGSMGDNAGTLLVI